MDASRVQARPGQPGPPELLVNVPKLITAYYTEQPGQDGAGGKISP
jgi:hypothetical protein